MSILMLADPKKIAGTMGAPEVDFREEAFKSAAEKIMAAIKVENASDLVEALKEFDSLCEDEEHEKMESEQE